MTILENGFKTDFETYVNLFQDHNIDLETRCVYVSSVTRDHSNEDDGVNGALSEQVIKNLHLLNVISDKPIKMILNTPGGNTTDGFAIYDAIKNSQAPVTIVVYGQASSMGSIIVQAGKERIMSANSEMLIHYGSIKMDGNVKDAISNAKHEERIMVKMVEIYMEKILQKRPKFSVEKLKARLSTDTILTAQDCVKLGLADKIGG